jgi:hypothetical protein
MFGKVSLEKNRNEKNQKKVFEQQRMKERKTFFLSVAGLLSIFTKLVGKLS